MLSLCVILSVLFPYLQNPQPTQMTVMWTATNEQQTGWVEYGKDSLNLVAREMHTGMYAAYNLVNRVTLTHLEPATAYRYRVVVVNIVGQVHNTSLSFGDTICSPVYHFTTPPTKTNEVSCLIFNDLHSGDSLMAPLLNNNAIDPMKHDFVVFNGDILNSVPGQDYIETHMLKPYSELFAHQVPFYYTRGNHEYRNKYARELHHCVTTPGTREGHPYYYTFTWGPCCFIVLDAGEDKSSDYKEYAELLDCDTYREQEAVWLKETLKSKACREARFRVVVMHVPFESSSSYDLAMSEIKRLFLPLCNQYKVDLAIHGHCHRAALFPANKEHHFPIVIGGGKRLSTTNPMSLPSVVQLHAKEKHLDVKVLNYNQEQTVSLELTR